MLSCFSPGETSLPFRPKIQRSFAKEAQDDKAIQITTSAITSFFLTAFIFISFIYCLTLPKMITIKVLGV